LAPVAGGEAGRSGRRKAVEKLARQPAGAAHRLAGGGLVPYPFLVAANRRFEVIMDFARHGFDVALRCDSCRHKRYLTCRQVIDLFGLDERIGRAELRLRCMQCGHRGGRMAPIPLLNPGKERR
jgi:hypothetical protein